MWVQTKKKNNSKAFYSGIIFPKSKCIFSKRGTIACVLISKNFSQKFNLYL